MTPDAPGNASLPVPRPCWRRLRLQALERNDRVDALGEDRRQAQPGRWRVKLPDGSPWLWAAWSRSRRPKRPRRLRRIGERILYHAGRL